MSQSRLEKVGTLYSRMSALLKAGAVRPEFKPIWFDVYEAFPPKFEPRWDRRPANADEPVPKILYREDVVRAQFYRQFGDRFEVFNLSDKQQQQQERAEPLSQVFIRKYQSLEAAQNVGNKKSFEELFVATVDALELDGIKLRNLDPEAARTGRWDSAEDRLEESADANDGQRAKVGTISFKELFSKEAKGEKMFDTDSRS